MAENSMAENYEYSLPKIEKQNVRTFQEVVEEEEVEVVDVVVTDPDPAGGHGPGHVTDTGQDPSPEVLEKTSPGIVKGPGTGEGPGLHVTDLDPTKVDQPVGIDQNRRTETNKWILSPLQL